VRWSYRWQQLWFEQNLKAVDAKCADTALRPPVFVLGMWRSGTTFLHELLAANKTLIAPNTWQCMNSSMHLLHSAPPGDHRAVRPMDSFVVSADSPQEDEFAMLAQGIPSVYRAFFDPRRLPELERWLDPKVWAELPPDQWWTRWRLFLASVQQGHSGRLLLKSPNHTFRISAILRQMPESLIVWVLRDPIDVFFSNVKMWKAMIRRYALWEVEPGVLDSQLNAFLAAALRFSSEALAQSVKELPRTQLAVVRFADLISKPTQVLASIHERLGLPPDRLDEAALRQVMAQTESLSSTNYKDRPVPQAIESVRDAAVASYEEAWASHGV
jgi:hypothetical protein